MLIFAIIAILLAAVLVIPLSVYASYDAGGIKLSVSAVLLKKTLFPKKNTASKDEKEDKSVKPKKHALPDFTFEEWLDLAAAALKALKSLKKGVYFELLRLQCTVSAPDPYDAVMRYNAINAAVSSFITFLEGGFRVKKKDVSVALDFDRAAMNTELELSVSLRIAALLALGVKIAIGFLRIYIRSKKRIRTERKASNGEQQTQRNDAVDNEQHQEPC